MRDLFPAGLLVPVGPNLDLIDIAGFSASSDLDLVELRHGVTSVDARWTGWPGLPVNFFTETCQITISATGTINSGVWLTGPTDPQGWNMLSRGSDWLYHDQPDAFNYSLIGAFGNTDVLPTDGWFNIGRGRSVAADAGMGARRLFLACNRPPVNGLTGGGDGHWTVTIRCVRYDSSDLPNCLGPMPPTMRSSFCVAAIHQLNGRSPDAAFEQARIACNSFGTDRANLDSANTALGIATTVLTALLAGIFALAAVTPGGAAGNASTASQQSATIAQAAHAATTIARVIAGLVGGVVGLTASAILDAVLEVTGLLTVLTIAMATLLGVAAAVGIAAAASVPTLWYAWAMGIAIAAAAIAFAVFLYFVGQVNNALQAYFNDHQTFTRAQGRYEADVSVARRLCCENLLMGQVVEEIPACSG